MPSRLRANLALAARLVLAITLVSALFAVGSAGATPSPEDLPAGTVAVVSQVRKDIGTITKRELSHTIAQAAVAARLSSVPQPGQPGYRKVEEQAFGELLDTAYLEGEAAARDIVPTPRQVTRELAAIKGENFKSEAEYRRFLRQSKFTAKDVRERVRLQMIATLLQEAVIRGVHGKAAQSKALSDFVDAYRKRWRARTVCAPEYATERCSNGPEPTA